MVAGIECRKPILGSFSSRFSSYISVESSRLTIGIVCMFLGGGLLLTFSFPGGSFVLWEVGFMIFGLGVLLAMTKGRSRK